MSTNPVRSVIEGIECEPSSEFLSTLRAELVGELARSVASEVAAPEPNTMPPDPLHQYTASALGRSPVRRGRRRSKLLLVAAACVAVLAIGAVIVSRADDSQHVTTELHDVNPQEALPLAQRALIGPTVFGTYGDAKGWAETELPKEAAATIAELPECALLTSVGLLPPTTKSVSAHQDSGEFVQAVFVFATPEDASQAMEVIAGKVFPRCWFNVYDRGNTFRYRDTGATTSSQAWDAPPIAPHGDRQVTFGQRTTINHLTGPSDEYLINGFVQVGRAIAVINVKLVTPADTFMSEKGIAAETAALEKVFGP